MGFFKTKHEPVILPDHIATKVDDLLARGEEIKAVSYVRDETGLGMRPAVNAVNARK